MPIDHFLIHALIDPFLSVLKSIFQDVCTHCTAHLSLSPFAARCGARWGGKSPQQQQQQPPPVRRWNRLEAARRDRGRAAAAPADGVNLLEEGDRGSRLYRYCRVCSSVVGLHGGGIRSTGAADRPGHPHCHHRGMAQDLDHYCDNTARRQVSILVKVQQQLRSLPSANWIRGWKVRYSGASCLFDPLKICVTVIMNV